MIIGTAGHIDHGKTALVKALTGVDTDRLPEEKRRGITIDLGYAYSDDLGFIDVPGHERFVHTMLAGASGIDAALLVVSLPEGVRQQTREHLQILSLLGVDRGAVALTKSDLAADRITDLTAELQTLLEPTPLASVPVVPVSAVTGQGIDRLRTTLLMTLPTGRGTGGYPRLAVDRVFTISGAGVIVTGTLISGRITVDDRLVLSPSGLELRVRGLHAQNKPTSEAQAGQRVALNVTGPRLSKSSVQRGDWVLHPEIHAPTDRIDARVTLLPNAPRGLRQDTEVHFHLAAVHLMARVSLLDGDRLEPGETARVRLTLQQPIGALSQDRIVLRDTGATCTIGGGVVLDPFPPRRGRRTPARLAHLTALSHADPVIALRDLLSVPPGWTDAATFMRARNIRDTDRAAMGRTVPVLTTGGLLLTSDALGSLRNSVIAALDAYHRASQELPGLQAERLRQALSERPPAVAFPGIIDTLVQQGAIARDGPWLRLPLHRITLSPLDEQLWKKARPLLAADRFRPPRTRDLSIDLKAPEAVMRSTLKRLQRMGQLVEVAPDLFFLRETMAEMAAMAADAVDMDGLLTAAIFRDRLNNGRKVAIQILEFFDRVGVTVRSGDTRRVRRDRVGMFGETQA